MVKSQDTISHNRRKTLEELNLIDDFLFQEVLSLEGGAEFARILLGTILGRPIRKVRVIPQKSIPGIDTDKHGIRLDAYIEDVSDELLANQVDAEVIPDIYDIEPDNTYEKNTLPRRTRYYHGMMDTKLLASGASYDELPNVVIITILPYDPFGKKRMVYTVRSQCVEDPSIPYDDGAQKIFIYTKGTAESSSQDLMDMLKYIEETTASNVTNQDIASIHKLVTKAKRSKEVGINYMKSWVREKMIRDEERREGREEGLKQLDLMNQLNIRLAEAGRIEDIVKAAKDPAYKEALLQEFCLSTAPLQSER